MCIFLFHMDDQIYIAISLRYAGKRVVLQPDHIDGDVCLITNTLSLDRLRPGQIVCAVRRSRTVFRLH